MSKDLKLVVAAFDKRIERIISGCTDAELRLIAKRYSDNALIMKAIERRLNEANKRRTTF